MYEENVEFHTFFYEKNVSLYISLSIIIYLSTAIHNNSISKECLSFRSFVLDDLKAVCSLPQNAQELFFMCPKADYPLTEQHLSDIIKERFDSPVIIFENKIVGFANFYEIEENKYCSIGNVVVDVACRNCGVATFLISVMETIGKEKYGAKEAHLSCFALNTQGLLLYTQLGYTPYEIERRKDKQNESIPIVKLKKNIR